MGDAIARRVLGGAAVTFVGTVVVTGWWTPGYDAERDTISRLAGPGQPYAAAVRAVMVLVGVTVIVAARLGPGRRRAELGLRVSGAALAVAGLVPKGGSTVTSDVHVAASVLAGVALVGAMAIVAVDATDERARRTARLAFFAMVVGSAVFPFAWGTAAYGVIERGLVLVGLSWSVAATVGQPGPGPLPAARWSRGW